ncbi:hypothetical protein PALB_37360 [Pseudoalteromonas luteoviolacea B = ATCC 29581]|nr:hypothetical protein PALB_37360 [Pseudoalteromonas luteoviolacea B = ATCC 29581]
MQFDGIMADLPAQKLNSANAAISFSHTPLYAPRFTVVQTYIALQCSLPLDAHEGDILHLSVTAIYSRNCNFAFQLTLTEHHIANNKVKLSLNGSGENGEYMLQANLYGKHGLLKNSNCFPVAVHNEQTNIQPKSIPPFGSNWISRAKHYTKHNVFSLLSIF